MSEITRSPLCWPNNVPRTAPHQRGHPHFAEWSISTGISYLLMEINRLNKRRWDYKDQSVIISTNLRLKQDGLPLGNQPQPNDTGVAVYFNLRFHRNGKWYERNCVLTCDKWVKIEDNIRAIVKDIEAQRGRERWGCTTIEQAFQGYVAIPEKCGGRSWWEVLRVSSNANKESIETAYKSLAKVAHPDMPNGSHAAYLEVQDAYDQAMAQFRS